MLNLGIIGLGVGVSHLRGVQRLANVRVKAICDTNAENVCEAIIRSSETGNPEKVRY